MVSGIPAYKESRGSITDFGFSYTFEDEGFLYPVGAVENAKGSFDANKKTLKYEDIVSYGSRTLARTVIEIKRDAQGVYLMQ